MLPLPQINKVGRMLEQTGRDRNYNPFLAPNAPYVCTSKAALRRRLAGNEHMLEESLNILGIWGAVIVTKKGRHIRVEGAYKG